VPFVRFYSQGGYPQVYLQEKSTFSLVVKEPTLPPSGQVLSHRIDVRPYQCNDVDPVGNTVKTYYQNFYLPWTAPNGATEVYGYDRVIYEDIYPEIDMLFYSGSAGQKLAFYCWPGSDPTKLALKFYGQDSLRTDINGDLKVWLSGRWIELREAIAYQVDASGTVIPLSWGAAYQQVNGEDIVNFYFDTYDPELPIVLQIGALPLGMMTDTPGLCWSTYFGGSGGDQILASTTDEAGKYYVTGYSYSDFMTFQDFTGTDLVGLSDAVLIAKFNQGYQLEWMVFYGGTGWLTGLGSQFGTAIVARQSGGQTTHIYVGGHTTATNLYPQPLAGAYNQPTGFNIESKGFLARFNPDGVINWSTYFGHFYGTVDGLDVDADGRLYVVGTSNYTHPQQPMSGATNLSFAGGAADMIVARFSPTCALEWCTPIGGAGTDAGADIICHSNGFFVSGRTGSTNFPVVGGGEGSYGGTDVVLMEFSSQATLVWSTHHGGSGLDRPGANSLALDADRNLVVVGETESSDMEPVCAGGFCQSTNSGTAGFIARYDGVTHALLWNSYVSGSGDTRLQSVSRANNKIIAAGSTGDPSLPITPNAGLYLQGTVNTLSQMPSTQALDGFVMGFEPSTELSYCTFFGGIEGANGEQINTTAFSNDRFFLGGYTTKPNLVPNAYFPLDDAGGQPAYYDESYDLAPLNMFDGFLTAICMELYTGIQREAIPNNASFTLHRTAFNEWLMLGLPRGTQHIDVIDSKGAILHQSTITIGHIGTARLHLSNLTPGIYTCKASSLSESHWARLLIEQH